MHSIDRAIETLQSGGIIIVMDDENRENEGDLVAAAEKITPETIRFMAQKGCGLICLALDEAQIDRLNLPMMCPENQDKFQTAFTVSIDAATKITTGISAADRALTIRIASNPKVQPSMLTRPGHMFPLRAKNGGVLTRPGHTEAAVDLARLAGLWPAGVICEIMAEDGSMMRGPQLDLFSLHYGLPLITIENLICYRKNILTRTRYA